jgi:hypothetical protein
MSHRRRGSRSDAHFLQRRLHRPRGVAQPARAMRANPSRSDRRRSMTRPTPLDTDTRGEDRGDSTPGPEGKRGGTATPPPRSARDPAEGKPQPADARPGAQPADHGDRAADKN